MHAYLCKLVVGHIEIQEDQRNYLWLTPLEMKTYDFASADLPIIDILLNTKYNYNAS